MSFCLKKSLLALCLFLVACEVENNISRDYRCLFAFDTSLHPIPCQLTGILGNPGHFCKIEASETSEDHPQL